MERKAPVSFQLADSAVLPNVVSAADHSVKSTRNKLKGESYQRFPIELLSSTPVALSSASPAGQLRPPTPPYDDNHDADAMDWTPTNKSSMTAFNPPTRTTGSSFAFNTQSGPSPFRGTLPPAPVSPAHRLRKPPANAPGAFKKASDVQKSQFSMNLRSNTLSNAVTPGRHHRDTDGGLAYDTDTTVTDEEDNVDRQTTPRPSRTNISLAAPKFWPQQDIERKTGLEDIFEDGFSIKDTPNEVARRGRPKTMAATENLPRHSEVMSGSPRRKERWGGFGEQDQDRAVTEPTPLAADGWNNMLVLGIAPAICLGIAIAVVKGGYL